MPSKGGGKHSERGRKRSRSDSVSSRSSYSSYSSRSSSSSRRRSPSPVGSDRSTSRRRPPVAAVSGPQLSAGFLRSHTRSDSASSSHSKASLSDDDGPSVGPVLPGAPTSHDKGLNEGARAFMEREARKTAAAEEAKLAAEKEANSRPDWMLLPPSLSNASSLQAVAGDPLNLKSRGFAQTTPRVSARGGGATGDGDMSLWTETPEERMKRMQDEALGVRSKDASQSGDKDALESERAARRDASIAANVAKGRGKKSLVEEHNERRKREMQEKLEDEEREKRRREKRRRRDEEDNSGDRSERQSSSRHSSYRDRDDERRRKHRSRSPDRKDKHSSSSSSSNRHRSSRHGESHRSHGSSHRSRRYSDASDDDAERRRERRKRRDSERRRDTNRRRENDRDKDKDRDRKSTKSRKEREEQDVREGKATAPMIWDREAALSIGGRLMDEKKRGKMIADANALGDRFGSGSRRFL